MQRDRQWFIDRWISNKKLIQSDYDELFDSIWFKSNDSVLVYSEDIQNVTHAELLTLQQSNSLVLNRIYRITDFQSKHLITGHTRGLLVNVPNSWNYLPVTCPTEPLLVKALTTNRLYKEAHSETYPSDYIEYELNPNDYDSFGLTLFGKIIFRKDRTRNISAYFDWRTFLFGRWESVNGSGVYNSLTNTGFGNRNYTLTGAYCVANVWYNTNNDAGNINLEPSITPDGYNVSSANNIVFQGGAENVLTEAGCFNINVLTKVNELVSYSGVTNYSVSDISPSSILQFNNGAVRAMKLISDIQYTTLTTSGNADTMHSHFTYQNQINIHKADDTNPHQTTKAQVGLGNCDNTSDTNKPVSTATANLVSTHTNRFDNPHQTTKAQVGLSNCDNTNDVDKPVSNATATLVSSHTNRTDNPHTVTKAQVGLDRVDNTSDSEKIVSNSTSALVTDHTNRIDNPHQTTKSQVGLGNCDDTSDINKPVSNATANLVGTKAPLVNPSLSGVLQVYGSSTFGDDTNKLTISTSGDLKLEGNATVWDDVDFPVIIRTTGVGIPTLTTVLGNITMPLWQVNDNNVFEIRELPHRWKEATQVTWHIHIITGALNAANTYLNFELEWIWANREAVFTTTVVSSGDILIPANTAQYTHKILNIGTWTPVAGTIASHVKPRLKRVPTIGLAASNPWLEMLQFHFEIDTIGSRYITTK